MAYQYSKVHFRVEEDALMRAGYPGFAEHKKYHDAFIEALYKHVNEVKRTQRKDPQKLLNFLKAWWIEHINNEDRAYADFLLDALEKRPEDFKR